MPSIRTFRELKSAGYTYKSIKDELRSNLIDKLKKKENVFEGIWGYEDTVIPDIERAILSRHDINLLGLRGQAKTRIARMMVKEYGMSEKLGLVTFEENYSSPFLVSQKYAEGVYSDTTAYEIDCEVKKIIDDTYRRVCELLEKKVTLLKELALVLLEKEVIESDEFEAIIRQNERVDTMNLENGEAT